MVEYGGGINHGPAGQVGGGGGAAPPGGGSPDIFASITHGANDLIHQVLALPPEMLAIGIVLVFLGIVVLKRAF